MSMTRIYYDSNENPRTISQMVKYEPEWAASRITELEAQLAESEKAREGMYTLAVARTNEVVEIEAQLAEAQMELVVKDKQIESAIKVIEKWSHSSLESKLMWVKKILTGQTEEIVLD